MIFYVCTATQHLEGPWQKPSCFKLKVAEEGSRVGEKANARSAPRVCKEKIAF